VDYEDAHLTPQLTSDMKAWEASFYDNSTDMGAWRPGFDVDAYEAEGLRLCQCLAGELGDLVGVEYHGTRKGAKRVVLRGTGQGTNPQARAAFQDMITKSEQSESEIDQLKKEGHTLTWGSYAPVKGERK
jgi:hypothetical protein